MMMDAGSRSRGPVGWLPDSFSKGNGIALFTCSSRRTVSAIAEHEICRRACAVFHTPLKIPLDFNPTLLGFAAEGLHGFA